MLVQNQSWTPILNGICPKEHKFCPLALESLGCIPKDVNCTGASGMGPVNDGAPDSGGGNGIAGLEYIAGILSEIPWHDKCPEGHIVCPLSGKCGPIWQCSLRYWASLAGMNNNSLVSRLNQSCPADSRYCLAAYSCVPNQQECPDLPEMNFNVSCKEGDCPPMAVPPELHTMLMNYLGAVCCTP